MTDIEDGFDVKFNIPLDYEVDTPKVKICKAGSVPGLYRAIRDTDLNNNFYIRVVWLPILRETPCGYWVEDYEKGGETISYKRTRKRYAYPTPKEALVSLYIRNRHYLRRCKDNLNRAEETNEIIEEWAEENDDL